MAVHARSENALDNTIKRFTEEGRGASISVMGSIRGKLPDSLMEVQKQFGDAVVLNVVDYRNRDKPEIHAGWQHLDILRSEGNHEQILNKLTQALENRRELGTITDGAYRQAAGSNLDKSPRGMAGQSSGQHDTNAPGRGLPAGNSEKALLETTISIKGSRKRCQNDDVGLM